MAQVAVQMWPVPGQTWPVPGQTWPVSFPCVMPLHAACRVPVARCTTFGAHVEARAFDALQRRGDRLVRVDAEVAAERGIVGPALREDRSVLVMVPVLIIAQAAPRMGRPEGQ